MSIWSKLTGLGNTGDKNGITGGADGPAPYLSTPYAFIDIEVGLHDHKIHDIGALKSDGNVFHKASRETLLEFLDDTRYICGHNIIHHDAQYLFPDGKCRYTLVDTLYVSPLLFPERPYHKLVKDDKLISDQMNNPVNDCKKAKDLLLDEIGAWNRLDQEKRTLFASLLHGKSEFDGFLEFVNAGYIRKGIPELIRKVYEGRICTNADLETLVKKYPCGLAYALALIDTTDYRSTTPGWVLYNYPEVELIIKQLRFTICKNGCNYCHEQLDVKQSLKTFFGYDNFRTYEGEPLQERAAEAAVKNKSLLAIFPTGGGKSLTFQLPALMAGRSVHGLTVVISPLQSLMKDQVDNLAERGITDAVTINGMLDPITRAMNIQRVQDGDASLLYISPEMLRSKTVEKILLARNVVRFVIDEAHCFSSWGQDFRVDYLYIGKFIRKYQEKKNSRNPVPVSCFTATAKQKVIQDICDYFKNTIDLNLELFASSASRTNLHYSVIHVDNDNEKYARLRELVLQADCPVIVYVSRTKRTKDLSEKLTRDGLKAIPFNGKMDAEEKIANQEAFMQGRVQIIVATSAFGMGVDKKDVGLVIHYNISDSLENYVQEAGRAGRDPSLSARCFVLFSDNDLDNHFTLLNQTKLSINEIQQVWRAVKNMTKERRSVNCSALEIARQAGWDDSVLDIETRVRTALATLEQSGYLSRGNNVPHVYATGITVRNIDEARERISSSQFFTDDDVENAVRIVKSLISQKHIAKARNSEAESRIDYLADILGLRKKDVISTVERMRQEGILADSKDMSVYLYDAGDSKKKSLTLLERFAKLEKYILSRIQDEPLHISYRQLNEDAANSGISTSKEKDIRTLLYFLVIKGYINKTEDHAHNIVIRLHATDPESVTGRLKKRLAVCEFTIKWLYSLSDTEKDTNSVSASDSDRGKDRKRGKNINPDTGNSTGNAVQFSVVELLEEVKKHSGLLLENIDEISLDDVEEALLYLSKIGALKLEGGFLVIYNAMNIQRKKDNKSRYKVEDYRMLNEFYKLKIQQIHIVGEYANLMVRDYAAAQQYVHDYFNMDYKKFVTKYFKGERVNEIQRNLTPQKYKQMFEQLSEQQMKIISDKDSRCIVAAAGPGSGKTRVLVHKLASLLMLEDVKHEQLLMLTFSRAAATEFKQRLIALTNESSHYVEITTFHSYCFNLLGRVGNLEDSYNVVAKAAEMIGQGEVEPNKIGKTVLVIDEAQDMGTDEYSLVKALMDRNEEMRVIAVGDDDQNIYDFRGSDSCHMYRLAKEKGGKFIEMTENYRSARHPVDFANGFLKKINNRIKTSPIISKRKEEGLVEVTRHRSKFLYTPVVQDILRHKEKNRSCVLTQTNEEAVIMTALLRKTGIDSKLIQSMDGLRFWNIAEMRFFIKHIKKNIETQIISDDLWEEAKDKTFARYEKSSCLPYVQRCIKQFERTYKSKYFSDFNEFVFESSVEDFCDVSGTDVVVSTIHKAKGLEFDDVYMLISGSHTEDDNLMRRYYVGITRAKNRLFIHSANRCFDDIKADRHIVDGKPYDKPEEIVLQLSHKDVHLDYFKDKKSEILKLTGGDPLTYDSFFLYSQSGKAVARLSSEMRNTLSGWEQKGYKVKSACVRFILAWKPKNAEKKDPETAVLLPDLTLSL